MKEERYYPQPFFSFKDLSVPVLPCKENQSLPTIFDFYSIENTINFLKYQLRQKVSKEDLEKYLWLEVRQTMAEFVFKEKKGRISYQWRGEDENRRLYPEGLSLPASEIFEKTANAAGEREKAELEGFLKIEEEFRKNRTSIAFWISPPSPDNPQHGNYGFVFIFINKEDKKVEVEIIRYQEDKTSLSQSLEIYQKLTNSSFTFSPPVEFFLANPIFLKTGSLREVFLILEKLGLEGSDFYPSSTEQVLRKDSIFIKLYHLYREIILSLAENSFDSPYFYYQQLALAKIYFTRLYNRALALAEGRALPQSSDASSKDFLTFDLLFHPSPLPSSLSYLDQPAIVKGGGSCPILGKNWLHKAGIVGYDFAKEIFLKDEEEYNFDREGICAVCHKGPKPLGPCGICKECDQKLREKTNFES